MELHTPDDEAARHEAGDPNHSKKRKERTESPYSGPRSLRMNLESCCQRLVGDYIKFRDTAGVQALRDALERAVHFENAHSYVQICAYFKGTRLRTSLCTGKCEFAQRTMARIELVYLVFDSFLVEEPGDFSTAIEVMCTKMITVEFKDILVRATGRFVTGDSKPESFARLLLQYLGSLCSPDRNTCSNDLNFNLIVALVMEECLRIYRMDVCHVA